MLANGMGMKRTVVFDQRRVLGDGWEIECVSRPSVDSTSEIGLLLLLWPAILIDMGDGSPELLELGRRNGGDIDVELAPTQNAAEVLPYSTRVMAVWH